MMDPSISRFWEKYIEKTKSCGVNGNSTRGYVRHAEAYTNAHVGIRLAQHTPNMLETYFKEKGRNRRLIDWQFVQIVRDMQILFSKMVQTSWAKSFLGRNGYLKQRHSPTITLMFQLPTNRLILGQLSKVYWIRVKRMASFQQISRTYR